MVEEDHADAGDIVEQRERVVVDAIDLEADVGPANVGRQPEAEEHQRQATRKLVSAAADDHEGVDRGHRGAGQDRCQDAEVGLAGLGRDHEADAGAGDHAAFDAEVDDAGALRDDLAVGGEHDAGAGSNRAAGDVCSEAHLSLRSFSGCGGWPARRTGSAP